MLKVLTYSLLIPAMAWAKINSESIVLGVLSQFSFYLNENK